MIPKDALKKIKSVTIYYWDVIGGFVFYDNEHKLIWKIGMIEPNWNKATVVLADSEVIVGLVCKLAPGWNSRYSDFQFQIGRSN
jgi:hypothetical protein